MSRLVALCLGLLLWLAPMPQSVSDAEAQAATESLAGQTLNELRRARGRGRLVADPRLQAAAAAHASDMARRGYFDHRSPSGSTLSTRLRRAGYDFCFGAENIALGQKVLSQVMRAWADSPPHRKNMLSREARHFGIASVSGARGRYWVMVLASDRC